MMTASAQCRIELETSVSADPGRRLTTETIMCNSLPPELRQVESDCECTPHSEALQRLLCENRRLKAAAEKTSNLAHDLNNLLHVLVGNSQLALISLQSRHHSNVMPILERIVSSARQGAASLSRLQDLASADKILGRGEGTVFDLAPLVEESVALIQACWRVKSQSNKPEISTRTDLAPGCFVKGRKAELLNVLINLLKNAVEAMPEGGDLIIGSFVDESVVCLQIRDTGRGIGREDLERIFEYSWSTKVSGNRGIGLHNVYRIVREHQGDISVESRQREGTCVTVTLPFVENDG